MTHPNQSPAILALRSWVLKRRGVQLFPKAAIYSKSITKPVLPVIDTGIKNDHNTR